MFIITLRMYFDSRQYQIPLLRLVFRHSIDKVTDASFGKMQFKLTQRAKFSATTHKIVALSRIVVDCISQQSQ